MKKIKFLLTTCFLSLALLTNCSEESTTLESLSDNSSILTNKLRASDLEIAISTFKSIMESSEYIAFNNAATLFAEDLNGQVAPIDNVEEFSDWIDLNLDKTKFSTKSKALQALGNVDALGTAYVNANMSFWNSLIDADADDMAAIFASEMGQAPNVTYGGGCQTTCMNTCSDQIDMLDYNYNLDMTNAANHGQSYLFNTIRKRYKMKFAAIAYQFADCMGNCA